MTPGSSVAIAQLAPTSVPPHPEPTVCTAAAAGQRRRPRHGGPGPASGSTPSVPKTIAEIAAATGQGDTEVPDDVKPAAKPQASQRMAMLVVPKGGSVRSPPRRRWLKRAGASRSAPMPPARRPRRRSSRRSRRAPAILKHATVVVAALPQKHGTVYRGRLSGLEAGECT